MCLYSPIAKTQLHFVCENNRRLTNMHVRWHCVQALYSEKMTIKCNMCECMSINGLNNPKQVQPRASRTAQHGTDTWAQHSCLFQSKCLWFCEKYMNNLENVKLDKMKSAIWARNIGHAKPYTACSNVEDRSIKNLKTRLP